MKNRLFCLLVVLACALMVTGCGRDTQSSQQETNTVSLELGEDNPAPEEEPEKTPSPSEQLEEIRPGRSDRTDGGDSRGGITTRTDRRTAGLRDRAAGRGVCCRDRDAGDRSRRPACPSHRSCRPAPSEELKNNPQQLDSRLYAVFQNVMEQNFDRKKGTLSVYRLNYDGTEGAYELEYDLTNAYDEEGKLNKNMEIDAQLKVAETMQSNINYGQGSREI